MKKILIKIPAMIGMLIALFSFFFYVQSFIDVESEVWILSVIVAMLSMPLFFVDAIISIVKAIKKDDTIFNLILGILLIGAIPMVVAFGGAGLTSINAIWNVYYLILFVLEVVSIVRTAKSK